MLFFKNLESMVQQAQTVVWRVKCQHCGSEYGVMIDRAPLYCSACGEVNPLVTPMSMKGT